MTVSLFTNEPDADDRRNLQRDLQAEKKRERERGREGGAITGERNSRRKRARRLRARETCEGPLCLRSRGSRSSACFQTDGVRTPAPTPADAYLQLQAFSLGLYAIFSSILIALREFSTANSPTSAPRRAAKPRSLCLRVECLVLSLENFWPKWLRRAGVRN